MFFNSKGSTRIIRLKVMHGNHLLIIASLNLYRLWSTKDVKSSLILLQICKKKEIDFTYQCIAFQRKIILIFKGLPKFILCNTHTKLTTKGTPLLIEKFAKRITLFCLIKLVQWHSLLIILWTSFRSNNSGLQFIDPSKHLNEDKIFQEGKKIKK